MFSELVPPRPRDLVHVGGTRSANLDGACRWSGAIAANEAPAPTHDAGAEFDASRAWSSPGFRTHRTADPATSFYMFASDTGHAQLHRPLAVEASRVLSRLHNPLARHQVGDGLCCVPLDARHNGLD